MEGAFSYVLTTFQNAELDLGKDSCLMLPLAMRTPTRTLPDVPVLVLFGEFQELRGTESVLR